MKNLEELIVGDAFQDMDFPTETAVVIVGDHVYTLSDRETILIVANDVGNGNGVVTRIININGEDEYGEYMDGLHAEHEIPWEE